MTWGPTTHERERRLPVRVMIVDDHAGIRNALSRVFDDLPDTELAGTAADGAEAVEACRAARPDVVVMDVNMPRMDGLEATRAIRAESPATRVVILTSAPGPGPDEVEDAGADRMVHKHEPLHAIVAAVRATAAAGRRLSAR